MLKEVAVAVAGNHSIMLVSSTLHSDAVTGGEGMLDADAVASVAAAAAALEVDDDEEEDEGEQDDDEEAEVADRASRDSLDVRAVALQS